MPSVMTPSYDERDLANETPRDENHEANQVLKRSFSWSKKKGKKKPAPEKQTNFLETEVLTVMLNRHQAENEVGMETHAVTGDVILSYVGSSALDKLRVGDCVLAINGLRVGEGVDDLESARTTLKEESADAVNEGWSELVIERCSLRTEVLRRHAALRGTSLDKLGLTLFEDANRHIVVSNLGGLAAKSRRCAVGDRLVSINGVTVENLNGAVQHLISLPEEELEVELEFVYGYLPPKDYEFDSALGKYGPPKPKEGALGVVRRSLSFGKKKKSSNNGQPDSPATPRTAESAVLSIPPVNTEPRPIRIEKNTNGMIGVTFKVHEVTGDLIIGLVADGLPAAQAGVEVGDVVLAIQGASIFGESGDEDLEFVREVLVNSQHAPAIELMVQKRVRTEVLEFGQNGVGGPKNVLGLSFYNFPDDWGCRITDIKGAAAKSGRLALGDRVVSMNGVRVNRAETLIKLIGQAGLTSDYIEFEVALGYSAGEGLWYGSGDTPRGTADNAPAGTPGKVKRSFSFGRKPRH